MMKHEELKFIAGMCGWFFISMTIAFSTIHFLFPNSPLSIGLVDAPVMTLMGLAAILASLGIFALGVVVYAYTEIWK
jgi:hypothetical protein